MRKQGSIDTICDVCGVVIESGVAYIVGARVVIGDGQAINFEMSLCSGCTEQHFSGMPHTLGLLWHEAVAQGATKVETYVDGVKP